MLAVVGLGAVEDRALVGGAPDLQGLAVEVLAPEGKHLPQPHADVGEDADHRLVAAGGFGEGVHLLEAEDADLPALLLGSWVIGSDPDSLERIKVGNFVGDRVLGHRREGAEDADDSCCRSALDSQHVVDQGEGVPSAQLPHRPLLQRDALDLHLEHAADAVLVGLVGPFRSWVMVGQVEKYSPRVSGRSESPYASSIACWASPLEGERALAVIPAWPGDPAFAVSAGVSRHPDDLPGGVAAFRRSLPARHSGSPLRWARKASTSAGSIRREAPSL